MSNNLDNPQTLLSTILILSTKEIVLMKTFYIFSWGSLTLHLYWGGGRNVKNVYFCIVFFILYQQ